MPRKAFVADIQSASAQNIPGITSVTRGADDNDVLVCFTPASGLPIEITAMVNPDVASYPTESSFMLWTDTPGVPPTATDVLQDIAATSNGVHLPDLVTNISRKLQRALAKGARNDPLIIDDDPEDLEMLDADAASHTPDDSEEDYGFAESDHFGLDEGVSGQKNGLSDAKFSMTPEAAAKINKRIRQDLRTAKFAGFSVGVLSGMKADSINSVLSLSIRIVKLGLSEEALQAWDLEPQQYIVLLIRYMNGYKPFDSVISEGAKSLDISFRVGISKKYKPTLVEALAAFTDISKDAGSSTSNAVGNCELDLTSSAGFSNMFISSSLNDFINSQFVSLLKIRHSLALPWDGAKRWFNDKQGRFDQESKFIPEEYYQDTAKKEDSLPNTVTADHLIHHRSTQHSFPLLAAQFCMRYLTRCTEFCLVCHDKMEEEFEALKPYVCNKPLCLYQYMSLGFGPSVEHEILTQPYVVDLLVSFCYSSACSQRLREYPTGMSLNVPPVTSRVTEVYNSRYRVGMPIVPQPDPQTPETASLLVACQFDATRQMLIFETNSNNTLRVGDWVVIQSPGQNPEHCRVESILHFPLVELSPPIRQAGGIPNDPVWNSSSVLTPATTPPPVSGVAVDVAIYNQNFDEMSDANKSETIVTLLRTLPSVKEMNAYLVQQSRISEPILRAWKDRISPAALGILRWIIASNRSCIVQVDRCPGQDDSDAALAKLRLDQRVSNVGDNWVQFRFAQGSPDKEQRFYNALKEQQAQAQLNVIHPTIWAWHGSPLQNWHSIIRSGLDFKEILHGRAYGQGVYHAMDQATSTGYAQVSSNMWHGSELKISSAMSLNEIVNCPSKFSSSNPYLVVQFVDWIQCRYLFVLSQSTSDTASGYSGSYATGNGTVSCALNPAQEIDQDPQYTARSTAHKPIGVPKCAATISRAFRQDAKTPSSTSKRHKNSPSTTRSNFQDWAVSEEDVGDIQFLMTDDEEPDTKGKGKAKSSESLVPKSAKPLTDFEPGSLDQDSLPMLQPPSYATPLATKSLNRALMEILAIQKKTPLHELGWYINEDLVSNVYQWIVELHSFDPELPLAKDMKAAGLKSVVLEVRFGKDFPFSPPFVRVIRPRFLPFMQGGGGHVTAGGAMCMELLTNTGWSSVSTIESVLLQVRMAIASTEPKPARLEMQGRGRQSDYGTGEAVEAFKRACNTHGWKIPPEFDNFRETESSSFFGS